MRDYTAILDHCLNSAVKSWMTIYQIAAIAAEAHVQGISPLKAVDMNNQIFDGSEELRKAEKKNQRDMLLISIGVIVLWIAGFILSIITRG